MTSRSIFGTLARTCALPRRLLGILTGACSVSVRAPRLWYATLSLLVSIPASAQLTHPRVLDRVDYEDRLRAMWLGEAIGNWTGIPLENAFVNPPFLTDASWGQPPAPGYPPIGFIFQNPWRSDDDTDIEYVFLHALTTTGALRLSPQQISDFWRPHINHHVWNSNRNARNLMERGVLPPATSMGACNILRTLISAQLTIEFYGALNPGMPDRALEMADLSVHTAAYGNAAHACQFYIILYSLATQAPSSLSAADQCVWLVEQARRFIPSTSKAADVCDFVLADFRANPDRDNWELTRDRIYERYQLNPAANGFRYRGFSDSSVNFATGVMSLLYGGGDYRRTIQIGTLSGWDCDNQPATMGGLLGLVLGYKNLAAQFPGVTFSDRYTHRVTRDALPDFLPLDPDAEDTFTLMARRMADITEREIAFSGGVVTPVTRQWVLPPSIPMSAAVDADMTLFNPSVREWRRSWTIRLRAEGRPVAAASTQSMSSPPFVYPYEYGFSLVPRICNGEEADFSGREADDWERVFYSSQGASNLPGVEHAYTVYYDYDVLVDTIRLIEGNHFDRADLQGGWLVAPRVQILVNDAWIDAPIASVSPAPDPARPYQYIDWKLSAPTLASAIRLLGVPGGRDAFAAIAELDALAPEVRRPETPSFDQDGNGRVDSYDVARWRAAPTDLDGDGVVDHRDATYFFLATRAARADNRSTGSR